MTARAEELETHIQALEHTIDELENRERRINLVIHGLTESPQESSSSLNTTVVKKIFKKHLKVWITSIERIHRLGNHKEGSRRPVILRLMNYREKQLIVQNAKKLKGTNIYIGEDFSYRVRSVRRLLWNSSRANRERREKVYLSYDKLKINGEVYIWDDQKNDKVKQVQTSSQRLTPCA